MTTSNALATVVPASTTLSLAGLVASAEGYAAASRAENTRRAYQADWSAFVAWCTRRGMASLPAAPDTLALYLAHLADTGRKVATIARVLASVAQAHRFAGLPSPRASARVGETMRGIRRRLGVAQTAKAPVLVEDLRAMVAELPDGLLGVRDRALLALGFAGAFRRSELISLDVADLVFSRDGLEVTIRRSKTDQEGAGRKVGIPYGSNPEMCPVRAVREWLDASGTVEGPVFRSVNRHGQIAGKRLTPRVVALVVKRNASAAGLDPSRFAGHSLRAGLATSAAKAGKSERAIMAQTGHRSTVMVRRYIRDGSLFSDNAAAGLL